MRRWVAGDVERVGWVHSRSRQQAYAGLVPDDALEAPAISVDYDYQHDNSGYVTVDGSHDQAPSHEVLWAASPDEDDPLKPNGCPYRFPNQGFTHLADTGFNNADVLLDFNPVLRSPECTTVQPE